MLSIPDKIALAAVVIAIVGWPAAAYFAYCFGLKSQRIAREFAAKDSIRERRAAFCGVMQGWRFEVGRLHNIGAGFEHNIAVFVDGISMLLTNAESISGDFTTDSRKRFDDLVAAVTKCDVYNNEKQLEAIAAVIEYVKSAA